MYPDSRTKYLNGGTCKLIKKSHLGVNTPPPIFEKFSYASASAKCTGINAHPLRVLHALFFKFLACAILCRDMEIHDPARVVQNIPSQICVNVALMRWNVLTRHNSHETLHMHGHSNLHEKFSVHWWGRRLPWYFGRKTVVNAHPYFASKLHIWGERLPHTLQYMCRCYINVWHWIIILIGMPSTVLHVLFPWVLVKVRAWFIHRRFLFSEIRTIAFCWWLAAGIWIRSPVCWWFAESGARQRLSGRWPHWAPHHRRQHSPCWNHCASSGEGEQKAEVLQHIVFRCDCCYYMYTVCSATSANIVCPHGQPWCSQQLCLAVRKGSTLNTFDSALKKWQLPDAGVCRYVRDTSICWRRWL